MKKIDVIIGVRPDFIRAAALTPALQDHQDSLEVRLIHTGQHYDPELSQDILEQLQLTSMHAYLDFNVIEGMGKLTSVMMSYENQIMIDPPDIVLVMGNSDSALACTLVAARYHIPVGHIDAGIRAYDNRLHEEQNDMLIDKLATFLFSSNEEAVINLIREGYDNANILEVGNIRADSVFNNLGFAEDSTVLDRLGVDPGSYVILTLHHHHVLNNTPFLILLFTMLEELSERLRIFVILHPATINRLEDIPEIMMDSSDNLQYISSQNYQDMLKLIKNAALVLTDSQGLQEETSILGVQCVTLGHASNRPITLSRGTNTLIGYDIPVLRSKILSILDGDTLEGYPMDGWEGKAGQRIAKILAELA